MRSKILALSLTALSFGSVGYFAFRHLWVKYIFAHIGALGILGLFAWLSGIIAAGKGLSSPLSSNK